MGNLKNKFFACLIGGAIGDALGAPIEFLKWEQIQQKFGKDGLADYAPAYGRLGAITDDTQLTIATAKGLLEPAFSEKFLIQNVKKHYLRWNHNNWEKPGHSRAPGNATTQALRDGGGTIDTPINNSKGAGAIMRSAPIGLYFNDDPQEAFQYGCQLGAITHGHPTGYIAAGAFAAIIANLANGISLDHTLDWLCKYLQGTETKERKNSETIIAIISAKTNAFRFATKLSPNNLNFYLGQGWIAEEALAIALYIALTAPDFKTGILASVNHSGDSDTTGAIAGNLLGLIHWQEFLLPNDPPGYSRMDQIQYWITNNEARWDISNMARELAQNTGRK